MSFLLPCILSKLSWPGWIWSFMGFLVCSLWGRGGREEVAGGRLEPTASCEAGGPEPPGGAGGQGGIPLLPTTLATSTRKTIQLWQGYWKLHSRSFSCWLWAGLGKQTGDMQEAPLAQLSWLCGAECCWPAGAQTQHCRRNPRVRQALATTRQVDALKPCI